MRVDVVRLGVNGEGIFYVPVGQNKDKIGFVDFVLPGESADIEITQDKSKFCRAKLIDLCSKVQIGLFLSVNILEFVVVAICNIWTSFCKLNLRKN